MGSGVRGCRPRSFRKSATAWRHGRFQLPSLRGSSRSTSTSTTGNQWYLNGNLITTDGTGQHYIASVSGNYTVRVTDTNGCKSCDVSYAGGKVQRILGAPAIIGSIGQGRQ